ncbi:Fatty acid hydroperoxide lyase 2 [Hibiscus syriacus]|uniref:Fatty acid hydroperoxide lyase 2 n=1 Tax=Hibiscus syriacus TaxID=106335 RepID=A0A6A3CRJ3_HIBSY|nr:Fatty acid hydroperoxide lyase 2 [Hibiscus syriacus]
MTSLCFPTLETMLMGPIPCGDLDLPLEGWVSKLNFVGSGHGWMTLSSRVGSGDPKTRPDPLPSLLEAYESSSSRLTLLQQRSPVVKGRMVEFVKNMANFAAASGKKHFVLLSSLDFGKWQKIDIGLQIHYLSSINPDGRDDRCEQLGWKYLSTLAEGNTVLESNLPFEDELEDEDYYPSLPFAALFSCLKAKGLKVTCLLCYCSEGDNIQDAFQLAEAACRLLGLNPSTFPGFTLSVELTQSTEILSAFSGIIVASVFSQELFFLHFHSADHIGLEGHYHWLLQLIVLISILAAIAIMFLPTSLPAVLVLSVSVVFQGCWFMNMGFMLWSPQFVPRGCIMQLAESSGDSMHSAVTCFSHEADIRARALANLQFIWILSGIMIFTGFICLNFAGKCTRDHNQPNTSNFKLEAAMFI